jgi:hypothetical protein
MKMSGATVGQRNCKNRTVIPFDGMTVYLGMGEIKYEEDFST